MVGRDPCGATMRGLHPAGHRVSSMLGLIGVVTAPPPLGRARPVSTNTQLSSRGRGRHCLPRKALMRPRSAGRVRRRRYRRLLP